MADTPGRVPMPKPIRDDWGDTRVRCVEYDDKSRSVRISMDTYIHSPAIIRAMADALIAGAAWVEDGQRAASNGGAEAWCRDGGGA